MSDCVNHSRRSFLEISAAVGAITIAPGILLHQVANAKPDDQPISDSVRWGMLININNCEQGCTDCIDACNTEHGLVGNNRPRSDTQYIRKVTLRDKMTGHELSLPLLSLIHI